jgi:L-arabinose isomerase
MWFKRSIQIKVYNMYLRGYTVEDIVMTVSKISEKDVNEIIDYINYLYH